MTNYPQILDSTYNTIIIALSDTELGKIVLPQTLTFTSVHTKEPVFDVKSPTVLEEVEALQFANNINDLMPKFIRQQDWQTEDGTTHTMLVMERLELLPTHHFDLTTRNEMIGVFITKMRELHNNGFVHGDFERPTMFMNRDDNVWKFKNIVQTPTALRLIDCGFAALQHNDLRKFRDIMRRERYEVVDYSAYYLGA